MSNGGELATTVSTRTPNGVIHKHRGGQFMSEPQIDLPISQFAYDVLTDIAHARATTPVTLIEEFAETLHNIPRAFA